jgi:aspartate-semialdehyde dehydrogenase
MQRFFKMVKNTNDFSKWSYCNGRSTQGEKYKDFSKWLKMQKKIKVVKNTKIFQSDFIVMSDLP